MVLNMRGHLHSMTMYSKEYAPAMPKKNMGNYVQKVLLRNIYRLSASNQCPKNRSRVINNEIKKYQQGFNIPISLLMLQNLSSLRGFVKISAS